jgi:hypothetical protein
LAAAVFAVVVPADRAEAALSNTPARTWGTNGRVTAILPVGSRIYVGGTFSAVVDTAGIRYPASNLAVFNRTTGSADLSFHVGTDGPVNALATNGSALFVGGAFAHIGPAGSMVARTDIAAIDPASGAVQGWSLTVDGRQVDSISYVAATTSLYVGGLFNRVRGALGTSSAHPNIAKVDPITASVDHAFGADPTTGNVQAIAWANDGSNRLFLGGHFDKVNGAQKTKSIAAVDATTGAVDPNFSPGPTNLTNYFPVQSIVINGPRLLLGVGGTGGACTALDEKTGAPLWSQHTNGDVTSVALIGATLYCGGHFGGTGAIAGQVRKGIAELDPSTGALLPMAPVLDSALPVWSLGTQTRDANLYVGGDFTLISFVQQSHFAMFLDAKNQGVALAPSGFRAQAGDGVVHLSWTPPSSDRGHVVTGYTIYRGTSPGGENLTKSLVAPMSTTLTFDDATAANGTTYYYEILTRNSAGKGPLSSEVSATPQSGIKPKPPHPPEMMTIANPPGEIDLSWNPPSNNGGSPVTSYTIYRSTTSGGEGTTPYATGVTGLAFQDQFDVAVGTTYYYVVSAVTSAGTGAPGAEVSAVETPGRPGTPTLSCSANAGNVSLTWTAPPDGGTPITKYVITRDAVRLNVHVGPSKTSIVDSTATPGSHTYRIKAVNAQGAGLYSAPCTVSV